HRVLISAARDNALPGSEADIDGGHVPQFYRPAAVKADADLANFIERLKRANRADHEHLRALLDRAPGRIDRRFRERLKQIVKNDTHSGHFRRVLLNVDLLDETAIANHFGHAARAHEGWPDNPV